MEPKAYYPDNGPRAIAARVAFLGVIVGLLFASLAPVGLVPHFLFSRHLEHFAAFYVAALVTALALPRTSPLRMASFLGLLAAILELARMIPSQHREWGVLDWEADFGGIMTAVAPIIAEKFRASFAPRD